MNVIKDAIRDEVKTASHLIRVELVNRTRYLVSCQNVDNPAEQMILSPGENGFVPGKCTVTICAWKREDIFPAKVEFVGGAAKMNIRCRYGQITIGK